MRIRKATTTGLLLIGIGGPVWAVSPCVERPTPPPCCADGHCYANPATWGWYETRWRRWPFEKLEPTATGAVSPELQKAVPSFEAPPAEEEDRRAPPPTAPREEAGTAAPANTEAAPAVPDGRALPPMQPPARPSAEPTEPVGPRRVLPPYTPPQAPGVRPSTGSGPTSDTDPPPALPFGPAFVPKAAAATVPQPKRAPATPAGASKSSDVNSAGEDPPPALPGGLAAAAN